MSSVVAEGAIRRIAKEARKASVGRISTDDATSGSREHPAYKPAASATGVLVALAQAGIRLSEEQRLAIKRLMRLHPEMASHSFTANTAVEHLITHGIQFSDAQLKLVSSECSVSVRYIRSGFEMPRVSKTHPVHRPRTTTVLVEKPGFFAWLSRVFSGRRVAHG